MEEMHRTVPEKVLHALCRHPSLIASFFFFFFFTKACLFIWQHQILVATRGILVATHGIFVVAHGLSSCGLRA